MLTFYVSCAFGDIFKTRLDPTVEQHYGKNIKFYFKRSTLSFNPLKKNLMDGIRMGK
jgi:hypothetical protein